MAGEFRSITVAFHVVDVEHLPEGVDADHVHEHLRAVLDEATDHVHAEHPDWFGCEPHVM